MSGRGAKDADAKTLITVRVTPRAGRDAVDGWTDDGVLLVRVRAAPAEGAANAAVARVVAKALGVAPSAVAIVRGGRARVKVVAVAGVPAAIVSRSAGDRGNRTTPK
jgi:uncharacterized protein YggU (UPF0235/DUF167 family)